jgi:ribosomal protein S18 acetylase RimI-like enzyme
VGKRLFNAFHDLMVEDGCRIIMIDTQADNVPARKFFERAGFGSLESHVYFRYVLSQLSVVGKQQQKEEGQYQEEKQQVNICLLSHSPYSPPLPSSLPPFLPL